LLKDKELIENIARDFRKLTEMKINRIVNEFEN
jgi:hypothetical protein